jgi:hypothetical protein
MAESLKKLYNCIIRYCTGAPCMWPSRKRKFIHFPMHIFHFVNVVFLYGCSSSVILFLWKWARFLYLDPSRSTGSSSLLKSSSSFSVKILALGGRSVALSYSSPNSNRESANEEVVMRTNENFLECNPMRKPQSLESVRICQQWRDHKI